MIAAAELRVAPLLADLADAELEWLAGAAGEVVLAPGQALALEGDPADAMYVILSGEIQYRREGVPDGAVFLGVPGELTGLLPFSRMTRYTGTMRATTPTRLASIHRDRFPEMLGRVPALEQRLVGALADRVREATRAEQQRDKLLALGRLSAGLAHEMNNPASAIRRGAAHLRERLGALPRQTLALAGCSLGAEQLRALVALQERKAHDGPATPLEPLEAGDREAEVEAWLEARGIPEPWLMAPTLVSSGVRPEELRELEAALPARSLGDALAWLASGLAAELTLRDVEEAAVRISGLVAAVRSYSRMDETQARAPVDVHEGLETTLTMLASRIRERAVRVERDYAPELPHPWGSPGDLNQVWTNLIDNALDACPPGGRLGLRTAHRGGEVVVEVRDDGPGIAPEVEDRIWEPFFTTKDVGEGTGLGLDIVRRIVVRQHGGAVTVQSAPGDTCFQVRLPVHPAERPAPPAGAPVRA
ncbi:MAG TPA: ATP-binding protein [Longimicrobiaceae bacterium]